MAILGNTTLITGRCYGNFITDGTQLIGTSSKLSNIPSVTSSDSNPLQVNGYAVASGYKVPNGGNELLCANGTTVPQDDLIISLPENAGYIYQPVYFSDQQPKKCNIFGKDSYIVGILSVNGPNGVAMPNMIKMYDYKIDPSAYGKITCTIASADKSDWVFSTSAAGTATISCTGGFYQTSDIRKKTNFRDLDLDKCYELIDKCQTVLFDYKDGAKDQMGMIAQEVEEFFPEIVSTDAEGFKSLDYAKLTVVILRVLKDLIKKTDGRAA